MALSWQQLEDLATHASAGPALVSLLLLASRSLGPVIRRFISLGFNRVWLKSGDVAYHQGAPAECLYVVISGRLRLLHEGPNPVTGQMQVGSCERWLARRQPEW
jgi:CRP-like cAMP-binding protein